MDPVLKTLVKKATEKNSFIMHCIDGSKRNGMGESVLLIFLDKPPGVQSFSVPETKNSKSNLFGIKQHFT